MGIKSKYGMILRQYKNSILMDEITEDLGYTLKYIHKTSFLDAKDISKSMTLVIDGIDMWRFLMFFSLLLCMLEIIHSKKGFPEGATPEGRPKKGSGEAWNHHPARLGFLSKVCRFFKVKMLIR